MVTSKAGAQWRGAAFSIICRCGCALSIQPAAARDVPWPSAVNARYRLSFNGFDVGVYDFTSRYDSKSYSATGKTKISALFGAFKWTGTFDWQRLVRRCRAAPGQLSDELQVEIQGHIRENGLRRCWRHVGCASPEQTAAPDAIKLKPDNLQARLRPDFGDARDFERDWARCLQSHDPDF